jgi:hypothetical protein
LKQPAVVPQVWTCDTTESTVLHVSPSVQSMKEALSVQVRFWHSATQLAGVIATSPERVATVESSVVAQDTRSAHIVVHPLPPPPPPQLSASPQVLSAVFTASMLEQVKPSVQERKAALFEQVRLVHSETQLEAVMVSSPAKVPTSVASVVAQDSSCAHRFVQAPVLLPPPPLPPPQAMVTEASIETTAKKLNENLIGFIFFHISRE